MSPNLHKTEAVPIATRAAPQSGAHNDDQIELISTLVEAIRHLLSQQGYPIDNIRLNDIVERHSALLDRQGQSIHQLDGVIAVLQGVGINDTPEVLEEPDAAFLPLLAYQTGLGWGVIDSQTPQKNWNFRQADHHTPMRTDE